MKSSFALGVAAGGFLLGTVFSGHASAQVAQPSLASTETIFLDCFGSNLLGAATISGSVTLTTNSDGTVTPDGLATLTLKRTGTGTSPITISGVSLRGELVQVDGLPDDDGNPTVLRAINVSKPTSDIEFIKISLDLPGFSSFVRTSDGAKYFSACK